MNDYICFYNKSEGDRELLELMTDSLYQIKSYYIQTKEDKEELDYQEGDEINLLNVLLSSSDLWIDSIIKRLEDLSNHQERKILIKNSEFTLLKYLVDFYWHNMPSAKSKHPLGIYNAFSFNFSSEEKKIIIEEDKNENINILRLVD